MPDFYREGTEWGARFFIGRAQKGVPDFREGTSERGVRFSDLYFFLQYVVINAHAHVRRIWYYPTGARIYRLRTSSDRMQTNNRSRFVVNF